MPIGTGTRSERKHVFTNEPDDIESPRRHRYIIEIERAHTRRHRDAASVAGSTMLRDGGMTTGRAGHRQERCVPMSAEIVGFASKCRTQRRARGEQRDHGTAGIARRRELRLSSTQGARLDRAYGKCRLIIDYGLTQNVLGRPSGGLFERRRGATAGS